ncbi:BGTF surface domain-containing protein [Haloarchaeobius amylolyticus]|uniref:BGTF surface domain-containing protein n=1 Tax=Haloarchaeobius amylolyticus TaxID=1198296 RepID=A0ABD6BDW3_9EURY
MTDDTTYRDKGRAVILAALMVLSVVAMSTAFVGGAAAAENASFENEDGSSTGFYEGETVTITDLNDGDSYEIRYADDFDSDGDAEGDRFEDEFTASGSEYELDTDGYETGYYYLDGPNNGDTSDEERSFELRTMDFRTLEFDEDEVDDDETVDLEINTNRDPYDLNVSADGLDEDDLEDIFGSQNGGDAENDFGIEKNDEDEEVLTLTGVSDAEDHVANFTDIDTGEYEFNFESTDTSAESDASINVTEGEDGTLSFADEAIETRTNTAEIPVEMENTDEAYLRVGTMDDASYDVFLHVEDDDDNEDSTGVVNVEMDTVAAADDTDGVKNAFSTADGDDDVTLVAVDTEGEGTELEAGDYPLALSTDIDTDLVDDGPEVANIQDTEDYTDSFEDGEESTSYLTLENRQPLDEDATTVHTAPKGELSDVTDSLDDDETIADVVSEENISDADTIADGDGMLVSVETDSLHAYFEDEDGNTHSTFGDISEFQNKNTVSLNITGEESGPNADPPVWTTNDAEADDDGDADYIGDEVEIVGANQSEGVVLLNIQEDDISGIETDESYDVDFTVDYEWDYASEQADEDEENEVASDSFEFEVPEFELDDSNEELPASADATVTGETNLAPHTEVSDRLRSAGNFTQSETGYVTEDGTYSIQHDLSEYSAGIDYELEAEAGDKSDDLEGTTIEGDELQSFDYDVSTAPKAPEEGDDVTGTVDVENPNDVESSEDVVFTFDGDEVYNDTVELEGAASDTIVDGETLLENASAGDYEWTLTADGDEVDSGTLTVEEPEKKGDDSGTDDSGTDDSTGSDDSGTDDSTGSDDSGTDDSTGSDDGGDDSTPGFGVGLALVALLGAAMLALRRQN